MEQRLDGRAKHLALETQAREGGGNYDFAQQSELPMPRPATHAWRIQAPDDHFRFRRSLRGE